MPTLFCIIKSTTSFRALFYHVEFNSIETLKHPQQAEKKQSIYQFLGSLLSKFIFGVLNICLYNVVQKNIRVDGHEFFSFIQFSVIKIRLQIVNNTLAENGQKRVSVGLLVHQGKILPIRELLEVALKRVMLLLLLLRLERQRFTRGWLLRAPSPFQGRL